MRLTRQAHQIEANQRIVIRMAGDYRGAVFDVADVRPLEEAGKRWILAAPFMLDLEGQKPTVANWLEVDDRKHEIELLGSWKRT